jgi:hypothetical protein
VKHDKDMSRICIQLLVCYINLTEGIILCTGTDVSILYSKRVAGCFNTRILFLAFTIILPCQYQTTAYQWPTLFTYRMHHNFEKRFCTKKKRNWSNNQLKATKVKPSHYSVLLLSNAEAQLCHFMTKVNNAKERKWSGSTHLRKEAVHKVSV